ncbi:hypothetical protein [Devosia marina]|uniref:Uncharacterized protein n=1 Tax=Devosia marina TaxID=2683198 RepID=A0A7X3FQH1_9HYPH|nr:hypothetical protein [Devosia marina]MVS98891.1 hypothetical protein [Devosia marina]
MSEPRSRAERNAEQRRKAATRSRAWRERRKAAGAPEARDIDAALAEAVSFYVARDGVNIAISPLALAAMARFVLERDGFDPVVAAAAVAARTARRAEHDDPHHMPSLSPGDPERLRPPKSGRWITPVSTMLKFVNDRAPRVDR